MLTIYSNKLFDHVLKKIKKKIEQAEKERKKMSPSREFNPFDEIGEEVQPPLIERSQMYADYLLLKRFFKVSRIFIKDININDYALFYYLKGKDSMN